MAKLNEITDFLDNYLDINSIKDGVFNGLQVEGKQEVNKIVFTVDSGLEVFQKTDGDMLIVHHGMFSTFENPCIRGYVKKRLEALDGRSLYAAHLPLDLHKEVGNNAQLLKLLGAEIVDTFIERDGIAIAYIGELDKAKNIGEIAQNLNSSLNIKCTVIDASKPVKRIAVCSGGGSYGAFDEAIKKGADLFLTGDTSEIYHLAKDQQVNVIFAGHHATETVGIKALMQVIKSKFDVECEFVDIKTGL